MPRWLILTVFFLALGCDKRDTADESPFQLESCDYVLLIAVDLSGSFRENMTENGKAYDFTCHAVDTYFNARLGGNDQVVIAQLSGSKRPLLWQGTPQQLRQEFPDKKAFRDYLLAHADPSGSRINDGVAEALNYLMRTYAVAHGKAKSVALILSDMLDNASDSEQSDVRLMDALTTYSHRGGTIGFYYCDQTRMADISEKMEKAGFHMCTLESDIHGRPALPRFE